MFGILGEQIDVTERLRQLGTRQTDSDMVTAGRLAIAFDVLWSATYHQKQHKSI